MNSAIHPLSDTSELVELHKPLGLYLKPLARLNITVQLPQIKDPGKVISNWDIMERLKRLIRPNQFTTIKVSKSTLEFVRFEAELDNRDALRKAIKSLEGNNLKMIGFFETFKIKAGEAKLEFPTRHDWDSFFRDAKNMDEMRPGERPDTIYLAYLPRKWFVDQMKKFGNSQCDGEPSTSKDNSLPSENILRRLFENFGEIRCVDIPIADTYRFRMTKSKSGMRVNNSVGMGFFSNVSNGEGENNTNTMNICNGGQELTFEAYVQFVEYISFVRAMDTLRGMKLVHVDDENRATAANIKVDFDRTKHLTDKNIRRRRLEREELTAIDRQKEEERRRWEEAERRRLEEERRALELANSAAEREKIERRRIREEKRRIKRLAMQRKKAAETIERRIRMEERKLLMVQRKLESVRLLTELFRRCQVIRQKEEVGRRLAELEEAKRCEDRERARSEKEEEDRRQRLLKRMEENLRTKVVRSLNEMENKKHDYKREQLRKALRHSGAVVKSVAAEARH